MAMPTKVSDLMFGEGVLDRTINWIKGEALKANTQEAYETAATEIHGINKLWIVFTSRQGHTTGLFESIALQNEERDMRRLAEDPNARAAYAVATKHLRAA